MWGMLAFLFAPSWSQGKGMKAKFETFNRELKGRVERE